MGDLKKLGKYEIRSVLGKGAMGIVYKGFDPGIERTVAIKAIRKDAFQPADMESILELSRDAGASRAAFMMLRLPLEIRDLFYEWLHQHYPLRAAHVISLIRQSRGGSDNDSRFGHRMRGTGHFAEVLKQRFELSCKKLGLNMGEDPAARTDLFRVPARTGDQFSLFD